VSVDLVRDERRLRHGLLATALLLLASLCVAGVMGLRPEWRRTQVGFAAVALTGVGSPRGIHELATCGGELDRCLTCHVGALRQDLTAAAIPEPYRSHATSLAAHPPHRFGCTSCHGGVGRALTSIAAHALPGTSGADPLMKGPSLEASCARCHLPGEVSGTERLVRGASLFMKLGCGMCHSLARGGRGAWDDGPDLRTLGRRGLDELKQSLFEPKADFAESTMPSYETSLKEHPDELTDLLVFVSSLTLPRLPSCATRAATGQDALAVSCSTCHIGERAAARLQHRCVYLQERRAELACAGCHKGTVLAERSGDCPVVQAHRPACVACHWESGQ
jgi:hypothetical protein